MSKCINWKTAASTCFLGGLPPKERVSEEAIKKYADAGVNCLEFSFSQNDYKEIEFAENPMIYKEYADKAGVELWSIHLPFSGYLDISHENEDACQATMELQKTLIKAAAKAKFKVVVIHPSSEPIDDSKRPARLEKSKKNLKILADLCNELGLKLAVEDLPRTCLGNCSSDILYLLDGNPNLYVCFDTNHLLKQENTEFIKEIGNKIITIHASDYDFIDERHWLPGDGKNDWKALINALENVGYNGPFLYEINKEARVKGGFGESLTPEDLKRVHIELAAL